MKRIIFFFAMIILFVAFSSAQADIVLNASAQDNRTDLSQGFIPPASLRIIENDAFEGTALSTVILPDALESIGENAFANIPTLKSITIPNGTTNIDPNAFKGSNQVTITSAPKSYAKAWAQENRIPFNPIVSFYAYEDPIQIPVLSADSTRLQKIILNDEIIKTEDEKPTGRMTGELHTQTYEECIAFHIQGRSPPMA